MGLSSEISGIKVLVRTYLSESLHIMKRRRLTGRIHRTSALHSSSDEKQNTQSMIAQKMGRLVIRDSNPTCQKMGVSVLGPLDALEYSIYINRQDCQSLGMPPQLSVSPAASP